MKLTDLFRAKALDDERKILKDSVSKAERARDGGYLNLKQFDMGVLYSSKPHDKLLIEAVLEWLRAKKASCEESLRQLGVEVE